MIADYKCDRCGLVFSSGGLGYQHYPVVTDSSIMRKTCYGHFCEDCAKEFFEWIKPVQKIRTTHNTVHKLYNLQTHSWEDPRER